MGTSGPTQSNILELTDAINVAREKAIRDFKAALKEEIQKVKGQSPWASDYNNGLSKALDLIDQVKPKS